MERAHKIRSLGHIPLLRQLPPQDILPILPRLEYKTFPKGARLIQQGEQGDFIYFIDKGTVHVSQENANTTASWSVADGGVVGEMSVLTGEPRSASVDAETDVHVWAIDKKSFLELLSKSILFKKSIDELIRSRKSELQNSPQLSRHAWIGRVLRGLDAQRRGLQGWHWVMFFGMMGWFILKLNEHNHFFSFPEESFWEATSKLIFGFCILQGACEALVTGAERVGARMGWDGFISGTVGSILSTLPEFVVISFLVKVDPLMAILTAIVTIFNNSIVYSLYAFFLPKDTDGAYQMPKSLTVAGGEILIAGSAVALTVGLVMLTLNIKEPNSQLVGWDLIVIGGVLIAIYAYYFHTLVRYYREGHDSPSSLPPDPDELGYDTRWGMIVLYFFFGILGSYCGGEAIGEFAEITLANAEIGKIGTSAILAFFAGISEYIIVYKSHRRGELGIALSNVFGGMTQVMFLLLPFGLLLTGIMGLMGIAGEFYLPIAPTTILLFLLLFPLFYTLHQYLEQNSRISNLGAAGMSGIYLLLLYFLFTLPI
ncbi:MAG: cyclic nucleotide-binding domain-containing protein [Bdellovibrionales bacterium]|nr:cyclic nucleotide-binding domain-containing protein [Bdellovibrionales bacterium]